MNYTVKWKEQSYIRKKSWKWAYACFEENPNRGSKIKFPTRQKAAQWIRNHRWSVDPSSCTICHPDGTKELFYPGETTKCKT